jgi:hypothetical protein
MPDQNSAKQHSAKIPRLTFLTFSCPNHKPTIATKAKTLVVIAMSLIVSSRKYGYRHEIVYKKTSHPLKGVWVKVRNKVNRQFEAKS